MGRAPDHDRGSKKLCRSTFEIIGFFLEVVAVQRAKPQGGSMSTPHSNANPLTLLLDRCRTLAGRVKNGDLPFVEAVDFAYSAADFAGLVDRYGDDQVQSVLADAFMGCRK
jgi:hypothetical protein